MESKLQTKIIKFLKEQGCYVIKTKPQPGIPVGCPDLIFLYMESWGAIECKASASAPYRVGQEATIKRLKSMNQYVWVAYPENWAAIRAEIVAQLF